MTNYRITHKGQELVIHQSPAKVSAINDFIEICGLNSKQVLVKDLKIKEVEAIF